ncbi:MAG TPA: MFS transporter [Gammaproteobacteria bacterium]|nr:MFS transporter [Gammaproteobacteria bacterium]
MSDRYPPQRQAWYAVGVLYLAYLLAFVDRQIIAFLVAPIRADLGITDFEFSLINGLAFAIFYAFLGVPLGLLADRWSRRNLVAIGIALWSAMTAFCGFAANYAQLFVARLGVGVGEGALTPSAISLISDLFPRERRGLPINIYTAGVYWGIGIAMVFGGLIVAYASASSGIDLPWLGHLRSWQAAFVLAALPGVAVALLALTFREPARHERTASTVRIADTLRYTRANGFLYAALMLGAAVSSIGSYGMYGWVPALFQRVHNWDSARIGFDFGLITIVFGTAGLVGSGLLAGRLLRAGARAVYSKIMAAAMALAVVPGLLLGIVADPHVMLACIATLCFLLAVPVGLVQVALQAVTPNEMRAQVLAVYLAIVALLGPFIGSSAVAALTDFYFANDAAVGRSISVVLSVASVGSVVLLVASIPSYVRSADALRPWSGAHAPRKAAQDDEAARRAW